MSFIPSCKALICAALLCTLISPAYAGTEIQSTRAVREKEAETVRLARSPYMTTKELEKYQPTIERIAGYLTNLTTIEADFTQSSSDGSIGEGKFYLQRPRQMRWEYLPPVPILIVSSGSELVYFDKELEQISRIPIDSTLAGFLAQEKIVFEGEIGIEEISNEAGVLRISISQRSKPEKGRLTLEFSDNPLLLKRMSIMDSTGQETRVSLSNAKFGIKLDPKLFVFKDTRKKRRS